MQYEYFKVMGVDSMPKLSNGIVTINMKQPKVNNQKRNIPKPKPQNNNLKRVGRGAPKGDTSNVVSRRFAPVQTSTQMTSSIAFGKIGSDMSRITHREPIGPVVIEPLNATSVVTLEINPGLSIPFPWLHNTANNYEYYKVNKLEIEFISQCPSSSSGRIIIAPEYDSADIPNVSLTKLEQMQNAYRNNVWANGKCVLSPQSIHAMAKWKYTRWAPLETSQDIKTYDICKLYLATDGSTETVQTTIGEIWINYDLTFKTPQPSPDDSTNSASHENVDGTGINTNAGTDTNWVGTLESIAGNLPVTGIPLGHELYYQNGGLAIANMIPGHVYQLFYLLTGTGAMMGGGEPGLAALGATASNILEVVKLKAAGYMSYTGLFTALFPLVYLHLTGGALTAWTNCKFRTTILDRGLEALPMTKMINGQAQIIDTRYQFKFGGVQRKKKKVEELEDEIDSLADDELNELIQKRWEKRSRKRSESPIKVKF